MNLSLTEAARIARQYPGVPEPAVVFHQLLTWPIANLLLMLLGLPLVLRFRNRNLLFGIGSALLLCAAYFAVTQICQDLGKRGEVGPAVAVWFPVVLFSSVAAAIVDYQRGARPRGIPQSAPDDPPI
jgi:lipopolysaccharide export system permease protein